MSTSKSKEAKNKYFLYYTTALHASLYKSTTYLLKQFKRCLDRYINNK